MHDMITPRLSPLPDAFFSRSSILSAVFFLNDGLLDPNSSEIDRLNDFRRVLRRWDFSPGT